MTIDTRQKRMSMLSFGGDWPGHTLFEADGAVDADDQYHLLHLYSGITLADVTPPAPFFLLTPEVTKRLLDPESTKRLLVPQATKRLVSTEAR